MLNNDIKLYLEFNNVKPEKRENSKNGFYEKQTEIRGWGWVAYTVILV